MEKILSVQEWYNSIEETLSVYDIANNYAKYLLEKQAEYINSQIRFDISVYSNEFIKNIEL